jgi:hypothetical protein
MDIYIEKIPKFIKLMYVISTVMAAGKTELLNSLILI